MRLGGGAPLPVIAGPCVIESEERTARGGARSLAAMARRLDVPLIFKASFDKANRSSIDSYRGPGLEEGLRILAAVKQATGLPLLTDVHEPAQCAPAAEVCDLLQIPAFLCRQTDLVVAAAETGRAVNVKKGQFVAPDDMARVVEKAARHGNRNVSVTERGYAFGYHNLVVDMRAFTMLHDAGIPVIFDVTHSLQLPGGGATHRRRPPLRRAAGARRGGGRRRRALPRGPPGPRRRPLRPRDAARPGARRGVARLRPRHPRPGRRDAAGARWMRGVR